MTAALSDRAAILRAVIDDPADDLARLAFADWCEEGGELERAEFIRVQIEAETPIGILPTGEVIRVRDVKGPRQAALLERESLLLNVVRHHWLPLYTPDVDFVWCRGFVESVRLPLAAWLKHSHRLVREHPLARVEVTDHEPMMHGDVLTPKGQTMFGWLRAAGGESEAITESVWLLLAGGQTFNSRRWKFYPTRNDALDALSDALLRFAKRQARH